jgi:uncharacterized protein YjbI with pentapeptide repeats
MNKEEKSSNKCPICERPTHTESKYCIFHASAEEKTEKEFKKALKKYVNKIKKENKKTFKGKVGFVGIAFKGAADFWGVTFEGFTGFNEATFEENAYFNKVTFDRYISFSGAIFNGYTDFSSAIFKGYAGFWGAIFKKNNSFRETTFKGGADFEEAIFEDGAGFGGAIFKDDANFKLKYLVKYLTLHGAKVFPGKKWSINVNNGKGEISFKRAYLENTYLNIELVEGVSIDFTDTLLRNTKIEKDKIENHILQEKEKKFSEAKDIYLLLKNNFHSIGQYEDESWAFIKEKDMDRFSNSFGEFVNSRRKKSQFKKILLNIKKSLTKRIIVKFRLFKKWLFSKKAIKWFNLSVSNFIYQYGENPWRVIRFALIIIFLFAIILNFSGIVISDRTNLMIEFIKKSQGDEYALRYFGPILGSFLNCLYFSVVTFTTLGYGDFQPAVGASRFFVSLESIIGAITMALFVYK